MSIIQLIITDLVGFGIVWLFIIFIIKNAGLFGDKIKSVKKKSAGIDLLKVASVGAFSIDKGRQMLRFVGIEFCLYLVLFISMR